MPIPFSTTFGTLPVFDEPSVDNLVIICKKARADDYPSHRMNIHEIKVGSFNEEIRESRPFPQQDIRPEDYLFELDVSDDVKAIIHKVETGTTRFGEIGSAYFGIQTFDRARFVSRYKRNQSFQPVIDGTNIHRYRIDQPTEFVEFKPRGIKSGGNPQVYKRTRIVVRQIGEYPFGAICPSSLYTLNTVYNLYLNRADYDIKFVLAILNSNLIRFYWLAKFYDKKATFPKIKKRPLESVPIKTATDANQKPFIDTVDRILAITKDEDYLTNPAKQAKVKELERQIDHMVYQLYDLTPEEIAIMEGHTWRNDKCQ